MSLHLGALLKGVQPTCKLILIGNALGLSISAMAMQMPANAQIWKSINKVLTNIDPTNQPWSRPAFRDWAPGLRDGVNYELRNCFEGSGCDLRGTNPGEMTWTITGARAWEAFMGRWGARKEREYENGLRQLRTYISNNYKCVEYEGYEGWCQDINKWLKVSMEWNRYTIVRFESLYGTQTRLFVQNCIKSGGIPLEGMRDFKCLEI